MKLAPGPELDAIVAEEVLGWKWEKTDDWHLLRAPEGYEAWDVDKDSAGCCINDNYGVRKWEGGKITYHAPLPPCSTDIKAAWKYIGMKFVRAGCAAWLGGDGHTGYDAGVASGRGRFEASSDVSVEHALCLAALKEREYTK